MTKLYFTVGLTDNIDYDGFVHTPEDDDTSADYVNYNIQRASTDIEKESISWKLNTNIPVTLNVIAMWEAIIRRPHLNMISIVTNPSELLQNYNSYTLNVEYINLLPINSELVRELQPEDYDVMTEEIEFGDLYLNEFSMYQDIAWENSLSWAYRNNDLSKLKIRKRGPWAMPKLCAHFLLREYRFGTTNELASRFADWAEFNKEELIDKGYIPGSDSCRIGSPKIGELVGDPWEEYQKLQTYPAICRTSITKVE